jgi:hypothetical protein
MKTTLFVFFLAAAAHAETLKIEAGPHHRINTVVTVPAPEDVPGNPGLETENEYTDLSGGAPDKRLLDRLWNDYAAPPTAAWE